MSSGVAVWTSGQIDVGRQVGRFRTFGLFKAFRALEVDHGLDNVQSLQAVAIKFYLICNRESLFPTDFNNQSETQN